ncbi:MAG: hypothetical protein HKO97_06420 [Flavobacteriaceae bacterium]|nr:hypothetical protein [Flavobacteriaceae bacterium]NNK54182.1 hypothetical protein [Flavobacteriaceae bacterium]
MLPWHQYLLGIIFVAAGFYHFRKPKLYERIMPPYIPMHSTLVLISGAIEMILGLMVLNPETQVIAAWGMIGLLILFLPVHIHMLQNEDASLKLPKWVLILRIPLQFALIYWVYQYVSV